MGEENNQYFNPETGEINLNTNLEMSQDFWLGSKLSEETKDRKSENTNEFLEKIKNILNKTNND